MLSPWGEWPPILHLRQQASLQNITQLFPSTLGWVAFATWCWSSRIWATRIKTSSRWLQRAQKALSLCCHLEVDWEVFSPILEVPRKTHHSGANNNTAWNLATLLRLQLSFKLFPFQFSRGKFWPSLFPQLLYKWPPSLLFLRWGNFAVFF